MFVGNNDEHRYDDIIGLPHYVSPTRPRMSLYDRAAQFSAFRALTGHEDAVAETARLTDARVELSEEAVAALSEKLQLLQERLPDSPEASITYFVPDKRKKGGAYLTKVGRIKKIDCFERVVVMEDKEKIPIQDIVELDASWMHAALD